MRVPSPKFVRAQIIGNIFGHLFNIFVTSNIICWLLGIGVDPFVNFLWGLFWVWVLLSIVQICYGYIKVLERH